MQMNLIAAVATDVAFTVILAVLGVLVIATGVWLLVRFGAAARGAKSASYLVGVVALGVLMRLICAALCGGYRFEMLNYNMMLDYFEETGAKHYYYAADVKVYPLTAYLFFVFGSLGKIFGMASGSASLYFMLKLPLVIADVVTMLIIYKIGKKYVNSQTGVVLAGIFALCPAFFIASGIWGTPITLALPLLAASFYMLVDKKHLGAIMLYALAMLTVREVMWLYPVYLVYYGYLFVRSIVGNAKQKPAFKQAIKDGELSLAYKLPVYFVGAFLLKYLISLPLTYAYYANPFTFINAFFIQPISELGYFTYNGLSVFAVFGKNADTIDITFPTTIFIVVFALLIGAITAVVYSSKKNRAMLPLIGAYGLYTIATYFADSTPVTTITVLTLLLVSYVYVRDRRLLQVFAMTSLPVTVVSMATMAKGEFLNNMSYEQFLAPEYIGSPALSGGAGFALLVICALISVIAHLYLTLVTFDISMSNNRKPLRSIPDASYVKGIKCLFK